MTYTATPKQVAFINALINKRAVPEDITATIRSQADMTSRQASAWIDTLKAYPFRDVTPFSEYIAAFEGVENSKYAIPAIFLQTFPHLKVEGHLFLEVKTYMGKRYLKRLHGSVGDFTRSSLPISDGLALLRLIKGRHIEFAQEFGKVFTVCGRCASPLTDERSRLMHLGPECRKVWGIR